jgi:hypothetical protein
LVGQVALGRQTLAGAQVAARDRRREGVAELEVEGALGGWLEIELQCVHCYSR